MIVEGEGGAEQVGPVTQSYEENNNKNVISLGLYARTHTHTLVIPGQSAAMVRL